MKTTPFRPVPSAPPSAPAPPELPLRPSLLPMLAAVFHLLTRAWWMALVDVLAALLLLRVILFCRRALRRTAS